MVFGIASCGSTGGEEAAATPEPTEVVGSVEIGTEASEEPVSTEISPTTGLPGNSEYRPVIVQVDNEATGRPQYGIQEADIVYEMMIEGADTRLTCLFNDNLPEKVGPVRSARVYHQYMASEWDAIFIHEGGPYVAGFEKSYIYSERNGNTFKVRIDGTRRSEDDILWHESVGISYCNVQKAYDEYNYTRTPRDPLFKFDENVEYPEAQTVKQINIPFLSSDNSHYTYVYDEAKDKFIRYRYGEDFIDAETKEAVEVQNIIVEYADRSELPNEKGRILMDVIGSGKAEFYIGGKHLLGTWEKDDITDATIYKLENGEEITLKPGNTWIEVQPSSKDVVTTYTDGTTYPSGEKAD